MCIILMIDVHRVTVDRASVPDRRVPRPVTSVEPTEVGRIWRPRTVRLEPVQAAAVFPAYCPFWDRYWAVAAAAA